MGDLRMKLKTLVSSMAILGLMSGTAFAAPATTSTTTDTVHSAFWWNIVNRNQDNASLVNLQPGQNKITGNVRTDLQYDTKRTSYASNDQVKQNADGSLGVNLSNAELYYDTQIDQNFGAHFALTYGDNFLQSNMPTNFFFTEAYATWSQDNLYAKLGQQYLNFGSASHSSIATPLAQELTSANATAVTLGAVNLNGFYVDGSIYKGTSFGGAVSNTSAAPASAYQAHGFNGSVGFAKPTATGSFNVNVSYLSNLNDTLVEQYLQQTKSITWSQANPAVSLHADWNSGPFTVYADYVTALQKNPDVAFNGQEATPSAYSLEADYGFLSGKYTSKVYLGYSGTQQLLGVTGIGNANTADAYFWMPKNTVLAGYSVNVTSNATVSVEYNYLSDYATSDKTQIGTSTLTGTGGNDNRVIARFSLSF